MPLQATSGAASYDAFGGGVAAVPNYIEDVFSTWLYTGNGSTQTINNGIDLAGKGGLVWIKGRNYASNPMWVDTVRGPTKYIRSSTTGGELTYTDALTSFNSSGFTLGADVANGDINTSPQTYVSWTFREQPKFFDVVTYTGNGTTQNIAHNLAGTVGCLIVKRTDTGGTNWMVYHRSLPTNDALALNTTQASNEYFTPTIFGNNTVSVAPTSTQFTVGNFSAVNASGGTYVAYLFAHNAGGFGLSGTDNVISCGSFTCPSSGGVDVNLGYEPQWILTKKINGAENWNTWDTMRGWSLTNQAFLAPNNSNAEVSYSGTDYFFPTATGFRLNSSFGLIGDYIYIAIRRGPMRTPTTGTSVFAPVLTSSNANPLTVTTNFPVDMSINRFTGASDNYLFDRLRGANASASGGTSPYLKTEVTNAEATAGTAGDNMQSNTTLIDRNFLAGNSDPKIYWNFKRAPGFFDVVCYTGNGSAQNISHNLGVVPELMIVKERNGANGWQVYSASLTNTDYLILNTSAAVPSPSTTRWNSTTPTSTVFSVGTHGATNGSGQNFVAYLFASCPGVSKVGSFTGTGSTQTINCGFTGGARFVLIKATSTTGDWYVWDSARGIVAGNDPYLELNTTDAEVINTDWVDTAATGFELSNAGGNLANSNGVSYIYLAIA